MHKVMILFAYLTLVVNIAFSQNLDVNILEKQQDLKKTDKKDIIEYVTIYDQIAELFILKNKSLEDENIDKTCNFVEDYQEIEFIKTSYYKTPFHEEVLKTLNNIVKLYEYCYPPFASKYHKSIIQINKNIFTNNSEQYAQSLDDYAKYLSMRMFNFKEAISYYKKAKKIRESIYPSDDSRVVKNYFSLALALYYHKSNKENAEKLILKSLKIIQNDKNATDDLLYKTLLDTKYFYLLIQDVNKKLFYSKEAEKLKAFMNNKKD